MTLTDTSVYTDLHGFASLRAQAQKNPDAALKEVAKQFESIFVQMMVKSMRDASEPLESEWGGNSQMKSYQQMFDQQLSLDLSSDGGLGLADIIARQLGGANSGVSEEVATEQSETNGDSEETGSVGDLSRYRLLENVVSAFKSVTSGENDATEFVESIALVAPSEKTPEGSLAQAGESGGDHNWRPESPKEFVGSLWSLAKQAGEVLKQNPKVILAQAALETGWGKFMISNQDGSNSFNLFGIKSGGDWAGNEAHVSTLEYKRGSCSTRNR